MLKIIIKNVYSKIDGDISHSVFNKLYYDLSYLIEGHEYSQAFKYGKFNNKSNKIQHWDGRKHLFSKNMVFLTGLVDHVREILDKNNVSYDVHDQRLFIPFGERIPTKNIEIRDYQNKIVDVALSKKGGIIKSATGSGKSVVITRLISEINLKTIVYVTGIDLLHQMHETFEKMLGTRVGVIGDGIVDVQKINVCTIWTASVALGKKYISVDDEDYSKEEQYNESSAKKIIQAIKNAELILFDECHMSATESIQAINKNSESACYKFGLSGTPWRDDGADLAVEAVCGKQIIDVSATELIKANWLVKPVIHFVQVPEKKLSSTNYHSVYKEYIVENTVRNDIIIRATKRLLEKNKKVLILVKNIKHGKILLDELAVDHVVYFVRGALDSDERNLIRQDFIDGKIDVIIASTVYDQGIDIKNLDALILAGSGKASGRALQRIGRVIRKCEGKEFAIVVDFIDNAKYLLSHSRKRLNVYKTEPGFEIIIPKKKSEERNVRNSKTKKTKKAKGFNPVSGNQGGKVSW